MTLAQKALADLGNAALRDIATSTEFFNRSTVYGFADGSFLTLNLYGPSYAA